MPQLPFVQFSTPSIGRKRPGFLERLGETAAQTGVAVAGQILASRVTARDMSQAQWQSELDTGRILRRTDSRNSLAVEQGVNPDEIGFEGPDGEQYFRAEDLRPIRAEQQLEQEQAERVIYQGQDIGSREEVAIAAGSPGGTGGLIPASLTEASLARDSLLAQRTEALRRDPNANVSHIDHMLTVMERDPNLTQSEIGQAAEIGARMAESMTQTWITMENLSRTDQQLAIQKTVNGLSTLLQWEMVDAEGKYIPFTLPMAIDIFERNERGLRYLEDGRMVTRRVPLTWLKRIEDLQNRPELIPSLSAIARLLIQVGEGKDFDGKGLSDTQLAQRLHEPAMQQRIGGYLLWAENEGCPECIISKAEAGTLPVQIQSEDWRESVRVAESIFRSMNPQLQEGFLTQRLHGFLGGELSSAEAYGAIRTTMEAGPGISGDIPLVPEFLEPLARGAVEAGGVAGRFIGGGFRGGAVRGENTEEVAALVGNAVDLSSFSAPDAAIVEGVAQTIAVNPDTADAMRLDWADRVYNPARYRAYMIADIEADTTLDADAKAAQIAVVRAATDAELRDDAARQRSNTLEGIGQGAK